MRFMQIIHYNSTTQYRASGRSTDRLLKTDPSAMVTIWMGSLSHCTDGPTKKVTDKHSELSGPPCRVSFTEQQLNQEAGGHDFQIHFYRATLI